jgi:peptidoglycan-associated lipoprotein
VARITVNEQPQPVTPPRGEPGPTIVNIPPSGPNNTAGVTRGNTQPATQTTQTERTRSFGESMLSILFDYDQSDLRPDQMTQMQADANWLKQNPAVRVVVEGHADERGNQEYNLALGARRANTVVQYLVSQGIPESRIRTTTYGKERPICQDATESCHQRNRRAAFTETTR